MSRSSWLPPVSLGNDVAAVAVSSELHLTLTTFQGATSSAGVIRGGFGKTLFEILPTERTNSVNTSES